MAAVQDLDDLGPAIEKRVEEMLRAVEIPDAAPDVRRAAAGRYRAVGWALAAVVLAAGAVWLVLRLL